MSDAFWGALFVAAPSLVAAILAYREASRARADVAAHRVQCDLRWDRELAAFLAQRAEWSASELSSWQRYLEHRLDEHLADMRVIPAPRRDGDN